MTEKPKDFHKKKLQVFWNIETKYYQTNWQKNQRINKKFKSTLEYWNQTLSNGHDRKKKGLQKKKMKITITLEYCNQTVSEMTDKSKN